MTTEPPPPNDIPEEGNAAKLSRGALQVVSGAVPLVGSIFAAVAGAWSEREQAKVNKFFDQWVRILEDEIREYSAGSALAFQQKTKCRPWKTA